LHNYLTVIYKGVAAKKLILDCGLKLGLKAEVMVTTLAVSAAFVDTDCAHNSGIQKAVIDIRNPILFI
jgi:hypothetical protein